jgi:hypothetical protein
LDHPDNSFPVFSLPHGSSGGVNGTRDQYLIPEDQIWDRLQEEEPALFKLTCFLWSIEAYLALDQLHDPNLITFPM